MSPLDLLLAFVRYFGLVVGLIWTSTQPTPQPVPTAGPTPTVRVVIKRVTPIAGAVDPIHADATAVLFGRLP